jgi:hypothetical protein
MKQVAVGRTKNNWRRRLIIVGLIGGAILFAACVWLCIWLWRDYDSFPSWVNRVRRPGYVLLYSTQDHDGAYYAIFDAGGNRLAFCRSSEVHSVTSLQVLDASGNQALDKRGPRFTPLVRTLDLGFTKYSIDDGDELVIKPELQGRLHVLYRDENNNPLLDVVIPWHESE